MDDCITAKDILSGDNGERLVYKTVNGENLVIMLVKPPDWNADDTQPAILWIHGGGWKSGNADTFLPHCRYFAAIGCVCFSVQYRLVHEQVSMADCLMDCKSAVRFIRMNAEKFGIHPDRVIVVGESAGGHLAASLGTIAEFNHPDDDLSISCVPNLIINCNGIENLTGKWIESVSDDPRYTPADKAKLAQRLSPLFHIHSEQPDMLLIHGKLDTTVSFEDSVKFQAEYRKAGNFAELLSIEDAKHAFLLFNYTASEEMVMAAIRMINNYLQNRKFCLLDTYKKNSLNHI